MLFVCLIVRAAYRPLPFPGTHLLKTRDKDQFPGTLCCQQSFNVKLGRDLCLLIFRFLLSLLNRWMILGTSFQYVWAFAMIFRLKLSIKPSAMCLHIKSDTTKYTVFEKVSGLVLGSCLQSKDIGCRFHCFGLLHLKTVYTSSALD